MGHKNQMKLRVLLPLEIITFSKADLAFYFCSNEHLESSGAMQQYSELQDK